MNARKRTLRETALGLAFVSPWLAGLLLLTLYPFVASLYWSFCRYDLLTEPRWIGTGNYRRLAAEVATGAEFGQALWNTAYYAGLAVPGSVVLGVGLALVLRQQSHSERPQHRLALLRSVFFLPSIVPTVATSILWMWMLDPKKGLVNRLLRPLGMEPTWLNSSAELLNPADWFAGTSAIGSKEALALMSLWGVGNFIVIYLAALQNIPRALYEAAELDGAARSAQFRHITLPQLSPVIFFNLVMGVVAAVQYFTQAYVVSGGTGGPEGSTRVLSLHIFLWAFKYQEAGYASAAAWLLFVLVAIVTLLLFRTSRHWVHVE